MSAFTVPQAVQSCHELLLWLIPQLDKFPRVRRFTLGERIEIGFRRSARACRSTGFFVPGKTSFMNFWVYILRCADGSYYTGHTDNLERRIAEHQEGELHGYTFSRHPVTVVYTEAFTTREEALACEHRIKGWSRQKKEAMIRGDWAEVGGLAKGGRPVR